MPPTNFPGSAAPNAPFVATMKTVYHIGDGPVQMYPTDANSAVQRFPGEWSFEPWPLEQTDSYNRSKQQAAVATAKAAGLPPPPPPAPLELYEEEQQVLSDYEAKLKEAREIVAKQERYEREMLEWDRKVAAARAFLAQAAPQPADLVAERESRLSNVRPDPNFQLPENWKDRPRAARMGFARRLGASPHIKADEADQFLAEQEAKQKALAAGKSTGEASREGADAGAEKQAERGAKPAKRGPE